MLEGREALTLEKIKRLPLRLKLHLNGGTKFSSRTDDNEEYGIWVTTVTSGRPKYIITSKILGCQGVDLEVDLRAIDVMQQLELFCKLYNEKFGLNHEG